MNDKELLMKLLEVALHDNNIDGFTEEEQEALRNWRDNL